MVNNMHHPEYGYNMNGLILKNDDLYNSRKELVSIDMPNEAMTRGSFYTFAGIALSCTYWPFLTPSTPAPACPLSRVTALSFSCT
jgi:hypothetical protein